MLAIALAMGAIGWYGLADKPSAKEGQPCIASQGVGKTADRSAVVCTQDMGWKRAQ